MFPGSDTQCPSVISYPADVPCPGPLPSSDLFNHVCDLGLFSFSEVCFSIRIRVRVIFNILLFSIFVCAAASLLLAWLVSSHVSVPYVIAGNTHFKHVPMLSLKMSRCLGDADNPAVILR